MRLRTHPILSQTGRTIIAVLSAAAAVAAAPTANAVAANPAAFDDLLKEGRAAFSASDFGRAESAYNQACPDELVKTYMVSRAVTCENLLGSLDEARGNLIRAEQRFVHAVAVAEQAGEAYRPLYCAKLIDLGEHYHRQGRMKDAETSLRKALEIARGVNELPVDELKSVLLPEALIRLGGLFSDTTYPERGRAPINEALALIAMPGYDGQARPPSTEVAFAHGALGMIELAAGNRPEAETHLRESVALATAAFGEEHPATVAYQMNLALVLISEGHYDRARLILRRAQFVLEARGGTPGLQLAVISAELADVAGGEGKLAEAVDYAQRAVDILSLQARPNARTMVTAEITLAGIYLRTHDLASAEKILPGAVETQRALAVNPDTLAGSVQLLANLRAQQHNWRSAEALYREAISLYAKQHEQPNPAAVPVMRALADVLKNRGGSKEEVRALENKAKDILRASSVKSGAASAPRV